MGKEISRRDFLGAVGVAVVASLAGCKPTAEEGEPPKLGSEFPEVNNYYPKMADLIVKEEGSFTTKHCQTRWFNFSEVNFRPKRALEAYNLYEELAMMGLEGFVETGGKREQFFVNPQPCSTRVLFLIPHNAPIPYWGIEDVEAATSIEVSETSITYIRLYEHKNQLPSEMRSVFATARIRNETAFHVEACQSSISISTIEAMQNFAQELFCNSYGYSFALQQAGLPYSEYEPWAQRATFKDSGSSVKLIPVPQKIYDYFQASGHVFKP